MEQLHALLLLAWALVRSLFSNLIGTKRGLAAFRENYAADRLPPVTLDERKLLPLLSACIACGLCDVGDASRRAKSKGAFGGTMDLVLASSRSMPDYDAALTSLAYADEKHLIEVEQLCPTRVPIREIVRLVRSKGEEIKRLEIVSLPS